ncbi:MAG: LON peptidase substrate-binding domain-containing protein [Phycisphaerales bacterium]|jgi:Lon protease-like protein
MARSIVVDFKRPVPLFPLGETVLLPHAVQGLHLFEPRYRQMVEDCLARVQDGSLLSAGPIAMATLAPGRSPGESPPLREAVCIGQIVQHERLADGRHNILLHGVCRAEIVLIEEPSGRRLYRQARLRPIEPPERRAPCMPETRRVLKQLLQRPRLQRLASAKAASAWTERGDLPTHAMVELIGAALVREEPHRYELLACADPWARARIVARTIARLEAVVAGAESQHADRWPKGLSWN